MNLVTSEACQCYNIHSDEQVDSPSQVHLTLPFVRDIKLSSFETEYNFGLLFGTNKSTGTMATFAITFFFNNYWTILNLDKGVSSWKYTHILSISWAQNPRKIIPGFLLKYNFICELLGIYFFRTVFINVDENILR